MAFDRSSEEDVAFDRVTSSDFYQTGEARGINPARWERIQTEVNFLDVVEELTGQRVYKGSFIHCPFHGRDTTASFKVYNEQNGYCYGCSTFFDSVIFVATIYSFSRVKALQWLEEKYKLPKLPDVVIEKEDLESDEYTLQLKDLKPAFLKLAQEDIRKYKDPALAEEYLRTYFEAVASDSPLPLARVLGLEAVQQIAEQMGLE